MRCREGTFASTVTRLEGTILGDVAKGHRQQKPSREGRSAPTVDVRLRRWRGDHISEVVRRVRSALRRRAELSTNTCVTPP